VKFGIFFVTLLILSLSSSLVFAQETIPVTYNDETYDVVVTLETGSVNTIDLDPNFTSMIVVLEPNSGGSMTIVIPRDLLDAKNVDLTDHELEVELDDSEPITTVETTTSTHRTLEFDVTLNTSEVEIIGTRLGPPVIETLKAFLTIDPPPTKITIDDTLTITGLFFTKDGEKITDAEISLMVDSTLAGTTTTDLNGAYSIDWTPSSDADVSLHLVYEGGTFTDGSPILETTSEIYSIIVDPICTAEETLVDGKCVILDTAPPIINVPEDITLEITNPNGVKVPFSVSASDDIDGQVATQCNYESDSFFSVGITTVTCTATDTDGNLSTERFNVIIKFQEPEPQPEPESVDTGEEVTPDPEPGTEDLTPDPEPGTEETTSISEPETEDLTPDPEPTAEDLTTDPEPTTEETTSVSEPETEELTPDPEPDSVCEPGTHEENGECVLDENGGGCLIATATFGSELAPQVQQLRELRDNSLLKTESGSAFMTGFNQFYYSFSPTIADWERQNPVFKESVKAFLTPMISTLSIMTLADEGSEADILGFGISVIALNLGIYIAAPALVGFKLHRFLKSRI